MKLIKPMRESKADFLEAIKHADEFIQFEYQLSWWQHWVTAFLGPKVYVRAGYVSGYLAGKKAK